MRCDVFETSGHVTAKSSIHNWGTFYKFSVFAMKVKSEGSPVLPREVCTMLKDQLRLKRFNLIVVQKSAEGILGCFSHLGGPN